ncbi:MAG: hypothetical protein IPK16_32170 [Anaerolineales bacterium]|nr:hypothetical protein [Anaerolineales bacterium]
MLWIAWPQSASTAHAADCYTVVVTSTVDAGAGSLRQALTDVCAGGTVTFDPALTASGPATVTVTSGWLYVNKNMTITGPGADLVRISGNNASTVFAIAYAANATISGLTIRDGRYSSGGNGGGGVMNIGTLTLLNSVVVSNTATGFPGGGIFNSRTLIISNTSVLSNTSTGDGGGVFNSVGVGTSTLTLINSTVSGNVAGGGGGGIGTNNNVATILKNTVVKNNRAGANGGGIYNYAAALTIENSSIAENTASGYAGGVLSYLSNASLTLINSTIISNTGSQYGIGGLYFLGTLTFANSIIANSIGGADCTKGGTIAGNTNNLVKDGTCSPAFSGDPLLAPLGDYGGPTWTAPLLPGSKALNAGDAAACLATDQRGVTRPQGSACDLGAFESQGFTLAKAGGDNQTTFVSQPFAEPLTATVSAASWQGKAEPVDGGQLTFAGPVAGAGVTPITTTATIAAGAASAGITANGTAGAYAAHVTAPGATAPLTYSLQNLLDCSNGPIHVNQAATGANAGDSWADAFTNLQSALTVAKANTSACEIWVATGVYTPGVVTSDAFTVTAGVSLYGGFAATETLRTQRNPAANLTVLSGDIDNNDIKTPTGIVTSTANISGTNTQHVLWLDGTANAITDATVLDGFTVTAGNATVGKNHGGGLYCNADAGAHVCSPTISNMVFRGNRAAFYGGAIYNRAWEGESSPVITNVTFSGNTAAGGGALCNDGSHSGASHPVLTNVVFDGNSADQGGANLNYGYIGATRPTFINVSFSGNTAGYGGAVYNYGIGGVSSPTFTNVVFSGNTATTWGGAILNDGRGSLAQSELMNVSLSGNSASYGGAIFNHNDTASGWSGAVLTNTIFWGNTATGGSQIYNENNLTGATINYSIVQGGNSGIAGATGLTAFSSGTGNLNADPLFVNAANGDLNIPWGSPAINTGTNTDAPGTDFRSLARPALVTTDIGAYEYQVIHVNQAATGANTGVSWADAFTDLQSGLAAARTAAPAEIWVAKGVYLPGVTVNNAFSVTAGVSLYGGFAATETLRTQRNWAANVTVLSGDVDNNDVKDAHGVVANYTNHVGNNAYHVLWLNGVSNDITNATVIDGFTVTAGKAA